MMPASNLSGKVFISDQRATKASCMAKPQACMLLMGSRRILALASTIMASLTMPTITKAIAELCFMKKAMTTFSEKATSTFRASRCLLLTRSAQTGRWTNAIGRTAWWKPASSTSKPKHRGETVRTKDRASSLFSEPESTAPWMRIFEDSKRQLRPWMTKPVSEKCSSPLMVSVVAKTIIRSTAALRSLKVSSRKATDSMYTSTTFDSFSIWRNATEA
mmetsp:Transcript_69066/g.180996  ORF Transcript_69066/g.180996 Transcript_69066/m.180996 type:complete len:218 (-) Transcript_69066:482-1135(-)